MRVDQKKESRRLQQEIKALEEELRSPDIMWMAERECPILLRLQDLREQLANLKGK